MEQSTVIGICVVGFHHERGNEIEWKHSDTELPSKLLDDITAMSIPDRAHLSTSDYCYFISGPYYIVSCFYQVSASEVKDQTESITRSMVQKSVVVVMNKPYYSAVRMLLEPCTKDYFAQGYFESRDILVKHFEELKSTVFDIKKLTEGISIKKLILKYGRNVLLLYKLLWLEKKIVFYGYPASDVCDYLLALISLVPYYLQPSSETPNDAREAADFGLPLKIFDDCYISPYVTLHNIQDISTHNAFIIGSSNLLFAQGAVFADLVVNTTGEFIWINKELERNVVLSPKDKLFVEHIMSKVKLHEGGEIENDEGNDEWIIHMFLQYTKHLLASTAAYLNNQLLVNSKEPEPNETVESPNTNTEAEMEKSEDDIDGIVDKENDDNPNHLHNLDKVPKSLPEALAVFNPKWMLLWQQSKNYSIWIENINVHNILVYTKPQHIAQDMKTSFEELHEQIAERALWVGDYLKTVYYSKAGEPIPNSNSPVTLKVNNNEESPQQQSQYIEMGKQQLSKLKDYWNVQSNNLSQSSTFQYLSNAASSVLGADKSQKIVEDSKQNEQENEKVENSDNKDETQKEGVQINAGPALTWENLPSTQQIKNIFGGFFSTNKQNI